MATLQSKPALEQIREYPFLVANGQAWFPPTLDMRIGVKMTAFIAQVVKVSNACVCISQKLISMCEANKLGCAQAQYSTVKNPY